MPDLIKLETPRLILRQWRKADWSPFARMNADPQVMQHFPAPLDAQASHAMAARCSALIEQQGWGLWALELKAEGCFIGFTGLHHAEGLPFSPSIEVGWRLASPWWGQGLATEAARAALGCAFDRLVLPSVVSFTALTNLRSRALMERLGMSKDSEFEHPRLPPGHHLRRHCLYRVSAEAWRASQERV